eukprot:scaffold79835_cov78-Cyclotella_meneghiniana.AAC.1
MKYSRDICKVTSLTMSYGGGDLVLLSKQSRITEESLCRSTGLTVDDGGNHTECIRVVSCCRTS